MCSKSRNRSVRRIVQQLLKDSEGATAVEYGLILSLVFLAMIGAVAGFGDETIAMWEQVTDDVESAREEAS